MRAVIQKTLGGPDVLEVSEVERPKPLVGDVLIRVHAAGVNPIDSAVRAGKVPLLGAPPFVLGWDVSGVVEEAGPGARFDVGDEVYGMPFFPRPASAYAEYVVSPSRQVARKPAQLDHVHAGALPMSGLIAWQGLVDAGRITEGDRVLIHRAAGGVGHLAVQIAKARGAHVIATASAGKHEFLRGLGADEVIDYRAVDFTEVVKSLDMVFDSTSQGERSLAVLRPGGTLVTITEHRDRELAARVRASGRRFAGVSVEPDYVALEQLAELADAGQVRPYVTETFELAEAGSAHKLVESGQARGKVVLTSGRPA